MHTNGSNMCTLALKLCLYAMQSLMQLEDALADPYAPLHLDLLGATLSTYNPPLPRPFSRSSSHPDTKHEVSGAAAAGAWGPGAGGDAGASSSTPSPITAATHVSTGGGSGSSRRCRPSTSTDGAYATGNSTCSSAQSGEDDSSIAGPHSRHAACAVPAQRPRANAHQDANTARSARAAAGVPLQPPAAIAGVPALDDDVQWPPLPPPPPLQVQRAPLPLLPHDLPAHLHGPAQAMLPRAQFADAAHENSDVDMDADDNDSSVGTLSRLASDSDLSDEDEGDALIDWGDPGGWGEVDADGDVAEVVQDAESDRCALSCSQHFFAGTQQITQSMLLL